MNTIIIVILIIGSAAALSYPLGAYLKWAMCPEDGCSRARGNIDKAFALVCKNAKGQNWKEYATSLVVFNVLMFSASALILYFQKSLPLNPDNAGDLGLSLIFNTAASFTTNTNLQHYAGESSLSYFSQLFAIMWLQFAAPAVGLCSLAAMARGFGGRENLGNFFIDMLRAVFLVLIPISLIASFAMIAAGVPMTLEGSAVATTLEGGKQVIARGPVAAFVAIKHLGTNGGGFFAANAAHPFESPTYLANCISLFSLVIIPMACVWFYGFVIKNMRQAIMIFVVMSFFLLSKTVLSIYFESAPTKAFEGLNVTAAQNFEGKELRLETKNSALWSVLTTCTSNGSVAAMHNSLNPMTGLVALVGMWLNSIFGGIGVGVESMIFYVILSVFLAGLMIGRTPEYLERKIGASEIKAVMAAIIAHPVLIIAFSAIFASLPIGYETICNGGARGFTEIVYEFTSAAANNGSGYEGLADNTAAWNISTAIAMLTGRFVTILTAIYLGGKMAAKKVCAQSGGSLDTSSPTFAVMLVGVILFLGALTFFPLAILGPVLEHLSLM